MATLTETAYYARKGVNIGIIVLVVVIVGRFLVLGALGLKDAFFPAPPPPANNALGPLPVPNFEGSLASPSGVTYALETVDGTLGTLPTTVTVYSLTPDSRVSFGTFDSMKAKAAGLGFTGEPVKAEGSTYIFTDPSDNLRTLKIDEVSGDFEIDYNYGSNLDIFANKNFTSRDQVVTQAREFFSNLGLLSNDLATGSAQVTYMRLDGQNLVPTTSLSNADAVYVSLNRNDIGDLPVVYPNKQQGLVSALIRGGGQRENSVVEAKYYHSTVDQSTSGTYNPITLTEAFDRLKSGNAIFSSLPNPLPGNIPIRSVRLGYLDPFPPQGFIQPVIIFSDDQMFEAYVPAVKY